jgi:hypothetical protein
LSHLAGLGATCPLPDPLLKEHEMRTFGLALLAAAAIATLTTQALAHGNAPHPKCKKGYALDASHKCVKAAKT